MKRAGWFLVLTWGIAAHEPPAEWIEPATGHRVIRLSREPGSASFYFHTFTPDGNWIVFRSNLHGPTHVYAVEVSQTAPLRAPPAR